MDFRPLAAAVSMASAMSWPRFYACEKAGRAPEWRGKGLENKPWRMANWIVAAHDNLTVLYSDYLKEHEPHTVAIALRDNLDLMNKILNERVA